jgi:hypothetical protein
MSQRGGEQFTDGLGGEERVRRQIRRGWKVRVQRHSDFSEIVGERMLDEKEISDLRQEN